MLLTKPSSTLDALGPSIYRGRFAPTPSGPLHFGSLVTAVGSYLDAKHNNGTWFVRIDNLDPLREKVGATDSILRTLDAYGFQWDEKVIYQSNRSEAYQAAINTLDEMDIIYYCNCSRKQLNARCKQGEYGAIYDGKCYNRNLFVNSSYSKRLKVSGRVSFKDRLQGVVSQDLSAEVGDFVLKRKDELYTYHLAVVVDDFDLGATHVIRGGDLLALTPQQIYIQRKLGIKQPIYAHLPLALQQDGRKLSKSAMANAVDYNQPVPTLWKALSFLGQRPPTELKYQSLDELWNWAKSNWLLCELPKEDRIIIL